MRHRQAYDLNSRQASAPKLNAKGRLLTFDAGVVILLFLAGLVPFSSLVFLLLAMCALSSYTQYHAIVRQELERQSTNTLGPLAQLHSNAERNRHVAIVSMMGTVGLDNLRLGMMNRDFDESGIDIQPAHCMGQGMPLLASGFLVCTRIQHMNLFHFILPCNSSTLPEVSG